MSKREDSREKLCERINARGDGSAEGGRTRISTKSLGEYERGAKDILGGDLHRLLNALGYPLEAWVETRNLLERLDWIGSRYVGTRGEVVDGTPQGPQSWIHDADGSLDREAVQREIRRLVRERSRSRERHDEELLELLTDLWLAGGPG